MNRLDELIKNNKLPVLFIGSGLSKRYNLNMPSWEELLKDVFLKIGLEEFGYYALKNTIRTSQNCTEQELYQKIGKELEERFNKAFYDKKVKNPDLLNNCSEWLSQGISPFKKFLSLYFSELKTKDEMKEELDALKKLSNKVVSIITTNYDQFIEQQVFSNQCDVYIGQKNLFNPEAVNILDLYKIHGCVSDPKSIVITEDDYKDFHDNGKLISAKLLTLITENPIIFIGYSINDENIEKILKDFITCLSEDDLQRLFSHIYFVQYEDGKNELEESTYLFRLSDKNITLPLTQIKTDNFMLIYEKLNTLVPALPLKDIKTVKRIVKTIVVDNSSSNGERDTLLVDHDSLNNIKNINDYKKFAIAIGPKINMNENFGYTGFGIQQIVEDILYDKHKFNAEKLVLNSIELKISENQLFPVHKYVSQLDANVIDKAPRVKKYITNRNDVSSFLNEQLRKSLNKLPQISSTCEIPSEFSHVKRMKLLLKNIGSLNLDNVKQYLISQYDANPNLATDSDFRRVVTVYDFLKYKKTP